MTMNPGIRKELAISYDEALARVPEVRKTEGFGVLTEMDVAATLKKKLDVDFRRYKILGACNPALAHEALGVMLEIGVMLRAMSSCTSAMAAVRRWSRSIHPRRWPRRIRGSSRSRPSPAAARPRDRPALNTTKSTNRNDPSRLAE
jgi:hypothetical protein